MENEEKKKHEKFNATYLLDILIKRCSSRSFHQTTKLCSLGIIYRYMSIENKERYPDIHPFRSAIFPLKCFSFFSPSSFDVMIRVTDSKQSVVAAVS